METPETTKAIPKFISWIKRNLLLILLFVLLSIFVNYKVNKIESIISESIIMPNAILDFQNKSGAARIKSSFTDLLIASEGSIKKGDGYEVNLNILNPSSITLHNIRCEFKYSGYKNPVICEDINMSISPGNSKTLKCFISDLSDYELKSIDVSVNVGEIYFY
jgi:hypothetical protein